MAFRRRNSARATEHPEEQVSFGRPRSGPGERPQYRLLGERPRSMPVETTKLRESPLSAHCQHPVTGAVHLGVPLTLLRPELLNRGQGAKRLRSKDCCVHSCATNVRQLCTGGGDRGGATVGGVREGIDGSAGGERPWPPGTAQGDRGLRGIARVRGPRAVHRG